MDLTESRNRKCILACAHMWMWAASSRGSLLDDTRVIVAYFFNCIFIKFLSISTSFRSSHCFFITYRTLSRIPRSLYSSPSFVASVQPSASLLPLYFPFWWSLSDSCPVCCLSPSVFSSVTSPLPSWSQFMAQIKPQDTRTHFSLPFSADTAFLFMCSCH